MDKDIYHILEKLDDLKEDILRQLKSNSLSSSSLNALFLNYQEFHERKSPPPCKSLSFQEFTHFLKGEERGPLSEFLSYYAKKSTFLFFLKQRALIRLSQKRELPLYDAYFSNISTLNAKNFPLGSPRELKLGLFSSPLFQWYQPHSHLAFKLKNLGSLSAELEFSKIFTIFYYCFKDFFPLSEMGNHFFLDHLIKDENPKLSQVVMDGDHPGLFSLFLNQLQRKKTLHLHFLPSREESFFLFDKFFLNLLSEQIFLNKFSEKESISDDDLKALSSFLKEKNPLLKSIKPSRADYVIFYSQKTQEKLHFELIKYRAKSCKIFLLASKPFFTPNSREKNQQLLQVFSLLKHFSFKEVRDFPQGFSSIYILEGRAVSPVGQTHSYSFFQFRGLFSSQEALRLYREFKKSSEKRLPMVFFKKNSLQNLSLNFFQDTLVEGILISTRGKKELTHPSFFQGISQNCIPLENLFKIKPLKRNLQGREIPLLPGSLPIPSLVLVLEEVREKSQSVQVHIIPGKSYLGFRKENGEVDFKYFALYPKQHDLNISLLRLFLQSSIGRQISDICLGADIRYRNRVRTLLIPKFFEYIEQLPLAVQDGLKALDHSTKELTDLSPQVLFAKIKKIEPLIHDLFQKYPLSILSRLNGFQENLNDILKGEKDSTYTNFNQPQLITEISTLKTTPLIPKHPDIFVELLVGPKELNVLISSLEKQPGNKDKPFQIEFLSQGKPIARLHTSRYLYSFLNFLLPQTLGLPMDETLKSLNLPKEEDLKFLLPFYTLDYEILGELNSKCSLWLEQLLKTFIISDHD